MAGKRHAATGTGTALHTTLRKNHCPTQHTAQHQTPSPAHKSTDAGPPASRRPHPRNKPTTQHN
jgi:hypothetical protein